MYSRHLAPLSYDWCLLELAERPVAAVQYRGETSLFPLMRLADTSMLVRTFALDGGGLNGGSLR